MPFIQNRNAEKRMRSQMGDRLKKATESGAEKARGLVPVRTGDLRSTIQVLGPVEKGEDIEVALTAGGVSPTSGNIVDYAFDIEIRTPYLYPAIPTIREALRNG